MPRDYPEHILFTGAGFTKNFGGLLAKEMWSKIFNNSKVKRYPRINELLINDFDYESIYHNVLNGNYAEDEKNVISDAILEAYRLLDDMCREWKFRNNAPNPVNNYGVNKLIERFSGGPNRKGFFFTLNQDLFVERNFNCYHRFKTSPKSPVQNHTKIDSGNTSPGSFIWLVMGRIEKCGEVSGLCVRR